jgi:hypothetical protein
MEGAVALCTRVCCLRFRTRPGRRSAHATQTAPELQTGAIVTLSTALLILAVNSFRNFSSFSRRTRVFELEKSGWRTGSCITNCCGKRKSGRGFPALGSGRRRYRVAPATPRPSAIAQMTSDRVKLNSPLFRPLAGITP